jgi:predicted DNA-binding transcriptional regulator AlpA
MPRDSTEQGTFSWSAQTTSHRAEGAAAVRPEAPPGGRGGGARGAAAGALVPITLPRTTPADPAPLPPDNELWDVHAAARYLGRSVSWVYHKAEDGTLPVKRLGGWGLRFVPGELRAWVEKGAPPRRG